MRTERALRPHALAGRPKRLAGLRSLWSHRDLIWQLTRREISLRYRGAYLGIIWAIVSPLLMLVIYTFVFSTIFHARWDGQPEGRKGETYFAMSLYAGLVPFTVFAEVVSRAPTLILSVPNYVKKVVFPLEVLPVVQVGSAVFQSIISGVTLLAMVLLLQRSISPTVPLVVLAYVPLVLLTLGFGWLLASLGVYLRDLSQGVVPVVQILTFLTPIFYPISAVPQRIRPLLVANPLTVIVEGFRQTLLTGQSGIFFSAAWLGWTAGSAALAACGYAFFVKAKGGFADVV